MSKSNSIHITAKMQHFAGREGVCALVHALVHVPCKTEQLKKQSQKLSQKLSQ